MWLCTYVSLSPGAFSSGSAFEAVINSVITIGVGLSVDQGNQQNEDSKRSPERFQNKLKESVKRVFDMLKKAV